MTGFPGGIVRDPRIDQNLRELGRRVGNLSAQLANYYGPLLNVKAYGARGDGTTDDTEAIKAAKSALGANGGTILFPYGTYKLSGKLNFDETRSVRLIGAGGLSSGAATATKLRFTQTGSEAAISARSTFGFCMADLGINYSSGSYTGSLVDLTHGAAATDSAYSSIERCLFAGESVRSAKGVNLDKAIICAIRGCYFAGLDVAVIGQKESGSYSNQIRIDGTNFTGMETAPIKNAGEAWYITGSAFDAPLHSGAAGAYAHDAGVVSSATTLSGCWLGDVTSTSGESDWINWKGYGLTVTGNLVGGSAFEGGTVTFVRVPDATSTGVVVTGNRLITGSGKTNGAILAEGVKNYIIGANEFSSITGKKVSVDGGVTDKGEGFLSN